MRTVIGWVILLIATSVPAHEYCSLSYVPCQVPAAVLFNVVPSGNDFQKIEQYNQCVTTNKKEKKRYNDCLQNSKRK